VSILCTAAGYLYWSGRVDGGVERNGAEDGAEDEARRELTAGARNGAGTHMSQGVLVYGRKAAVRPRAGGGVPIDRVCAP
jgi:hypothetical protein